MDKGADYQVRLYMRAVDDANRGRYTTAADSLRTLRGLYPKSVKVLVASARVETNAELARKFIARAYELDPDNPAIEEAWDYIQSHPTAASRPVDKSLSGQLTAAVEKLYPIIFIVGVFAIVAIAVALTHM